MKMPDTVAATRKQVAELAQDAFKDHVLTKVTDERWRCARPNSWTYGFFVIICPGAVIVYGDIQDGIFRWAGDLNNMDWLRDAVKDREYLLSKLQHRRQCFYVGDALAWAEERRREFDRDDLAIDSADAHPIDDLIQTIQGLAEKGELYEHNFARAVVEAGLESEGCSAATHDDPQNFWLVHALKRFVELHDRKVT